jgi:hypothetical protein
MTPAERFWAKTVRDPDSDCWEWIGATTDQGYGTFFPGPGDGRHTVYAHRWLYEQTRGVIPANLELDHLCRNRACVNPDHLEPVNRLTNMLRGAHRSARAVRSNRCLRGHDLSNAYVRRDTGARQCRECKQIRESRRGLVIPGGAS